MSSKKTKRIIYRLLLLVFGAVFAVSAFMVIRYYYDSHAAKEEFTELSGLVSTDETDAAEAKTASERYASLYAENNDFIGWVSIEGTTVDYPVMQTRKDPEYYLRRGFDKKYSYHGVPFIDADCTVGISDNTIIYGHNMLDKSMFSVLENYKYRNYYTTHKYFTFDTLWEYGRYEIIAVVKSTPKLEKEFAYYGFVDAWSEEHFNDYIKELKANSLYKTDATALYGDKLVTLSTCEYSVEDGRLAVIGKKIS